MAVRYVEIGQYPDVRREVRGNLSEILAATANPGTYAAPEDVTGTFLEMGTDGKWAGASVGTMSKATADALYASGALANLETGATYRDTSGTQYTYGGAGAGWVSATRDGSSLEVYAGDAWLGDSIYSGTGGRVWSSGNIIPTNASDPDWVHALGLSMPSVIAFASRQKFRAGLNFGVGGDTSSGILQRVGEVASTKPRRCFVGNGTNDLGTKTANEIAEYTRQIAVELLRNGIEPIITPIPPKNDMVSVKNKIQSANFAKQQVAAKLGVKFLSSLWDGMISSDGAWASGQTYTNDYTHPNMVAMFKAYDNCKDIFSQYDGVNLPQYADGNGIYTNQVMAGAGGVPTGWSAGTAAGLTRSLVARADGCGNDFTLACVGVTAALTASTTISVTPGNLVLFEFDFGVSGASAGFYSDVRFVSGSVTGKMLDPLTAFNYSGICRRELRIPAGVSTVQLLLVYGYQSNTGVGTADGTVRIGRLRIVDLTAAGLA